MKSFSRVMLAGLIAILMAVWIAPTTSDAQFGKKKKVEEASQDFPPCNGPKKRIAIYRFKDGARNNMSSAIRDSMLEALQEQLTNCGCFVVLVTNEDMEDAATEIRHGQSGQGRADASPQAGQQLGAQAIFQGTIMEAQWTQSQGGGVGNIPLGGRSAGGVGLKSSQAKIVIQIKMFDPETRVVTFSQRAEGIVNKTGVAVSANIQGVTAGGKLQKETPLGDAALMAIHKAVVIIITKMNSEPWQATILKVTGNSVMIRGDASSGLKPGQVLNVYKPGEFVEDPDTKEKLRLPATKVGQVKVTGFQGKFIMAEKVSGIVADKLWVMVD